MRIEGLDTTARDVSEGKKAAALRRGASNALAGGTRGQCRGSRHKSGRRKLGVGACQTRAQRLLLLERPGVSRGDFAFFPPSELVVQLAKPQRNIWHTLNNNF